MESGSLTEPLWDAATVPYPYPNNGMFVREYTIKLLCSSFPNMTTSEVLSKTVGVVQMLMLSAMLLPFFFVHLGDPICRWTF